MKREVFKGIDDFQRLVESGKTPESKILEFKGQYDSRDPKSRQELRKDIVAMANTFGGTILIGVREQMVGTMKVAGDLCDTNIEKSINWITSVVAQRIYPSPLYDIADFIAPDASGYQVRILAINVQPTKDGLTALQDDRDGQDWLCFPYRDDYGVKVYHPSEAIKRMNSHARRIYIIANELQITGKSVRIASPVFRYETEEELENRLRPEYVNYHYEGQTFSDYLQDKRIEIPLLNQTAAFGAISEEQIELRIYRAAVSVPLGAVQELWKRVDSKLEIALKCDLVISGFEEPPYAITRFHAH